MPTVNGLHPATFAVLRAMRTHLDQHGEPASVAALAGAVGVSRTTVTQRLAVLEARGWVRRHGRRGPRNSIPPTLTDKPWPGETT